MYRTVSRCRACGTDDIFEFLNLHDQPLANNYHDGTTEQDRYPLRANLCRKCFHVQLSVVVDPRVLYEKYLYVSGTSRTLREYTEFFADLITSYSPYPVGSVLDVACNDGTQLDAFKRLGWRTFGVDPAKNIVGQAKEKGHYVVTDFWSPEAAEEIFHANDDECVDIITAQNVFAHTDDVLGFLFDCEKVMHDYTLLVIQTSQADMVKNGEFDTMYHEHLSFFNTKSMKTLVERAGMKLEQVLHTGIHGTSYVFIISLNGNVTARPNVEDVLKQEEIDGLYNIETYQKFAERSWKIVSLLRDELRCFKEVGYRVVGYGAAAKGMTVLNYGDIDHTLIDYIVDDAPLKQGLFTPGSNIPIYSSDMLASDHSEKIVFVPLAWNFYDEIRERIKKVRNVKEDLFVRYFPQYLVEI